MDGERDQCLFLSTAQYHDSLFLGPAAGGSKPSRARLESRYSVARGPAPLGWAYFLIFISLWVSRTGLCLFRTCRLLEERECVRYWQN